MMVASQRLPTRGIQVVRGHWPLLVLLGFNLALRWLWAAPFIEDRDGLFFVAAVERYALVALRPHWPGYPVYMWLGMALNALLGNAVQALHLLSVLATSLCLLPLAALARLLAQAVGQPRPMVQHAGLVAALL